MSGSDGLKDIHETYYDDDFLKNPAAMRQINLEQEQGQGDRGEEDEIVELNDGEATDTTSWSTSEGSETADSSPYSSVPDLQPIEELGTWDSSTTDIDKPCQSEDTTCLPNSFKECYYFYNFLRIELEKSCFKFANQNYGPQLKDYDWRLMNLVDEKQEKDQLHMVYVQWHQPGQIALEHWIFLFQRLGCLTTRTSKHSKILLCMDYLRQTVVHRYENYLTIIALESAMSLPSVLGDEECASRIQLAYNSMLNPADLSEEQKTEAAKLMDSNNYTIITQDDLLGRIQHLLEFSCFRYAKRQGYPIESEKGWNVPENVELQRWQEYFDEKKTPQDPSSLAKYPAVAGDRSEFKSLLWTIRQELRNKTVHRRTNVGDSTIPGVLEQRVRWAIKMAIMVGDPAQADDIQNIADAWYERNPRPSLEDSFITS